MSTGPQPGSAFLLIHRLPALRRQLREELISSGFRVDAAKDGAEAVSLAKQHRPDFIILEPTSVEPPLWDEIRAASGPAPVVLTVAANTPTEEAQALVSRFGAMGAAGRVSLSAFLQLFASPASGVQLSEGEREALEAKQRQAAFQKLATESSLEELLVHASFLDLLSVRLESQKTPLSSAAIQYRSLMEFASFSGGNGVGFYMSHAEPEAARTVAAVMGELGWNDDQTAFVEIVGLAGGYDALGDDPAELALLDAGRQRFGDLEKRLRFTDSYPKESVVEDLKRFVRERAEQFP